MKVQNLDDITNASVEKVGGKAANLAKIIAQGFPVPPGFVINTLAYADHLAGLFPSMELKKASNNSAIKDPVEDVKAIRDAIFASALSHDLEREILARHNSLQAERKEPIVYVVRSSATAEDMAFSSFAGQHESYYYVSEDNLMSMVKACWASLWSEAACSYRNSQGINHFSVKMAVIIQEMVPSDVSGITFTEDPVTGDNSIVVIESSWGMGAAIVDGRVTPDQFIVHRKSRSIIKSRISDKRYMVPPSPEDPEHMRLFEVPEHKRKLATLSEEQIQEVTKFALRAEEYFGCPQDIEWAFHKDSFYILQSRPVTSSGEIKETLPKGKYVLFKPIYENFTDPVLPLSSDILEISLEPLIFIYGRCYINLGYIKNIIPLKLSDSQIAQLSYLSSDGIGKIKISLMKMPFFLFFLIMHHLIMGVFYRRTADMPDDFMDSFRSKVDEINNDDSIDALEVVEKLLFSPSFFEPVGNMPLLANPTAARYWLFMIVLNFLFKKWLPHLPKDASSKFISGTEGILSTQMGHEITDMSDMARENKTVKNIILKAESSDVMKLLEKEPEAAPLLDALGKFLTTHGHRGLKEMEIGSQRWEENPVTIINMLKNYLHEDYSSEKDKARKKDLEKERRQLILDIQTGLNKKPFEKLTGIRWRFVSFLGKRARYFIKLRENSRFFHIMIFYAIRKKVLKKEADFLKKGKLKCADDIFYLKWNELKALDSGQISYADIEDTIRSRRLTQIRLGKVIPPKTVGIEVPPEPSPANNSLNKVLQGQGASPGVYKGRARVILDPSVNATLESGEILVAPYTDPAWTPLFLTAGAAVVGTGSYLSHAGTIAREYGMPCVVDVPECTSFIKSGDTITIDGTEGKVILEHEEELIHTKEGNGDGI